MRHVAAAARECHPICPGRCTVRIDDGNRDSKKKMGSSWNQEHCRFVRYSGGRRLCSWPRRFASSPDEEVTMTER